MQYVLDSHTHTLASGHAYNTINEMVQAASEKGLQLLGITEHAMAMPGTCHELYFANLRVLRRQMSGIEVMFGAEVNIMDSTGKLDMEDRMLKRMDVVVASLHIPCIKPGTVEENTAAVLEAIRHPYVNIIGHPDDGRYPLDYEKVVQAAKEHHVLLEVNNTSLNPQGVRKNAWENLRTMLKLCCRYEAPVILDSDAHCAEDVGSCCYSKELISEIGFPEELIVNRSVSEYKKFINRSK